ncbi:MAG: hypothetical protein IID15_07810, partial [Candidatus Marinimicrobia bacterium]|nr:hypothetical protein [Candidatus Neomarinimicrobiota bacterium]
MTALADHYDQARQQHPDDRLLIMFDIDGTILDMRYMMLQVLRSYDHAHGSDYFHTLTLADITVSENQIDELLQSLPIPSQARADISTWFDKARWSPGAIHQSHRPFNGVLEVIRWFQLQRNTSVGLNTGRPDSFRDETLRLLNALGDAYRVHFPSDLLFMNPGDWASDVLVAKVQGIRYFEEAGYRVIAFIDNEPANLAAIDAADPEHEILLLHAATIFESQRERVPSSAVAGESYDLTALLPGDKIPGKVQLVWHAVNSQERIEQFLRAQVHWGEFDIRRDPARGVLVSRLHGYQSMPPTADGDDPLLADTLARLKEAGRGVKLDLRDGLATLDEVIELLHAAGLEQDNLWFNGRIERLLEEGFRQLSATFPSATLQCSIDFLAPLILGAPDSAKE